MRKTGLVLLFILAGVACWYVASKNWQDDAVEIGRQQSGSVVEHDASVESIVSSEELILALTPELRRLNKSLANLQIPDEVSRDLFADTVMVASRVTDPLPAAEIVEGISRETWDIKDVAESVGRNELVLWEKLFSSVKYIEHGKFYFVRGSFIGPDRTQYQSDLGSTGSALLDDARILGWTAKVEVTWSRAPKDDRWTISSWKTKSLETTVARASIFTDVLADVIEDDAIYSLATTSLQEQKTSDLYLGIQPNRLEGDKYPYFFSEVTLEHPAVAVVDIDSDGYDDVFVAMQHSTNLLLRNKQNGRFEECASRYASTRPPIVLRLCSRILIMTATRTCFLVAHAIAGNILSTILAPLKTEPMT